MDEAIVDEPRCEAVEQQQQRDYPGLRIRRDGDAIVVHVPARFYNRIGKTVIVNPGESFRQTRDESKAQPVSIKQANPTLVVAVAKAYRWQDQIESGEFASIKDLAASLGVDRSYVARTLRLTSLAPDIVEAILYGEEPNGLSLAKLRKDLPVGWAEQWERWR